MYPREGRGKDLACTESSYEVAQFWYMWGAR